MTQVSTQETLRAALLAEESEIQVTADFDVAAQQNVTYPLMLHSAPGAAIHTISKTAGFSGSLLRVSGGGALTLENLVLDGSAAGSYQENPANRTLIQGMGGSIHLGAGAVLQNNSSYQEGGGVYLSGDPSYVNTLLMDGDAVIRGCSSRTSGGGLTAALRNNADSVRLAGEILIEQNTAANGAGVYLRSYLAEVGGALSIEEQLQIRNNQATANGGGIYCSSFSTGDGAPISLLVEGEVEISSNQAASGGGIYFYSANQGDRLTLTGPIRIAENTVTGSGGGVYLTGTDGATGMLGMDGVAVSDNTAGATGGGLCLGSGAGALESILDNCTISGNTATANSGGGIWSGGSNDTLLIRSGTVITQNSSTAGNGGGVYFNSDNGILILSEETEITYNRADAREIGFGGHGGGVCVVPGHVEIRDQVEIAHNSAGKFGGGLSAAEESVIIMSGGSIHDNRSGQEGGGVWNHVSSRFTQTGGSIENNAAQIGGGLYNDADSTASILGGVIRGNTSTQSAPGVYNAGTLYTQGLRELANGLYIENRGAVAYLSDALAEGTVLQLENSGYVTPNPVGASIVVGEATPQYPRLSQMDADGIQKPLTDFDGWEIRLSEDSTQVLLAPEAYALRYENAMGAQNLNPTSYTVLTPTITLLPLADTPGGHFLGWFNAPEDGIQVTEISLGSTGDKTLYARWEAIEYTVTYYGNAAGGSAAENVPQPQRVQGGERVLLSDMRPTRRGYLFAGWNTEPNGGGVSYQPGEPFGPIFADADLYAQWAELPPIMHTLTYHGNDAGGTAAQNIPGPVLVPDEQSVTLSNTIPTREGFVFSGWNTEPDGAGTAYRPGGAIPAVRTDVDLYAQWIPLPPPVCYTLSYCGNDAGGPHVCGVPRSGQVPAGQYALISCCVPYRACYCFTGWNTDPCGKGQLVCPGQSFGPMKGDVCLYAQWRRLPPPEPICHSEPD